MENLDLLTTKQAAEYLGISVPTIQRYVEEGRITYVQFTEKTWRFRRCDLDTFIVKNLVLPTRRT